MAAVVESIERDPKLSARVQQLQAVFLFAADIIPTKEPKYAHLGWRSGRGLEQDKTGPVFSYERVRAAAVLYEMNPELKIVPSGGMPTVEGENPPAISSVIAFELMELGVPKRAIIEEPRASNTLEQVRYCGHILEERGWSALKCGILAPFWQFARIYAMLAHMDAYLRLAVPLAMERTLAAKDPSWNEQFAEWYATPEAREMFAKEALGAGQLWAGHQPKYPKPFAGFLDPLG